jgi:hypothetical protein
MTAISKVSIRTATSVTVTMIFFEVRRRLRNRMRANAIFVCTPFASMRLEPGTFEITAVAAANHFHCPHSNRNIFDGYDATRDSRPER